MYRKTAFLGVMIAFALILSYIEYLVPFYFGAPGIKLGMANLIIVLILYQFGWKEALAVNVIRIILTGFLFGNLFAIIYSISGAFISFLFMLIIKKTRVLSIYGVSICGGVSHNLGQLLVAMFIVKTTGVLYYIPILLVGGVLTGFLIGILASQVFDRLSKNGEWI